VNLFHFFLLRSVGKGAFGKVRVVQHKHSKTLYALKYINKPKCVKMKAVANIVQERRLLEEVSWFVRYMWGFGVLLSAHKEGDRLDTLGWRMGDGG